MSLGDREWHKSSRSAAPDNECLEICFDGETVLVRDSKNPAGPVLQVSIEAWTDFVEALRHGDLDRPPGGR